MTRRQPSGVWLISVAIALGGMAGALLGWLTYEGDSNP